MYDKLINEARDYFQTITASTLWQEYERRLPLSPIWATRNAEVMREILAVSCNAINAVKKLQAFWFQQIPSKRTAQLAVEWQVNSLAREGINLHDMPSFCQESKFAPEESLVLYEGRSLRPDFFRHLGTFFRIQNVLGKKNDRINIFELGAGTGNFARLFKLFYPNSCYVISDLPDTLCFSYMFLRLNFPEAKILFKMDDKNLTNKECNYFDFVFIPVHLRDAAVGSKYTLFVNTASLGEMKRRTVEDWFRFIQTKLNLEYIISVNRYLNTILPSVHLWRLEENTSAFHFDKYWEIIDWECEPSFTRCPYNNKHARQLLIVAKRLRRGSHASPMEESRTLCQDALIASWNETSLEMTYQDNVLVNDLTMSGILFKLWEALRLQQNEDTLFAMLRYLDSLIHRPDRHFEEYFQYADALQTMIDIQRNHNYEVISQWLEKHSLTSFMRRNALPILVATESGFNIVKIFDRYIALDLSLGPVDLRDEMLGERDIPPHIYIGNSLDAVRSKFVNSVKKYQQ